MITASVLDYIGKYEGGILVSVGLMHDNKFHNGIFYYTENKMIITIEDRKSTRLNSSHSSVSRMPSSA